MSAEIPIRTFSRNLPTRPDDAASKRRADVRHALEVGFGTMLAGARFGADVAGMPGVSGLLGRVQGGAGLGGGPFQNDLLGDVGADPWDRQMELLELQQVIQARSEMFQTLSNVSKSDHDARMAAVRNIRP